VARLPGAVKPALQNLVVDTNSAWVMVKPQERRQRGTEIPRALKSQTRQRVVKSTRPRIRLAVLKSFGEGPC
jgi:hypothetical protein